jgi:orotidine-5'-phosphate decarboxylase
MPDNGNDTPAARDRIAIVLDTDDLVAAMRPAKAVQPHIANAKVGLELWSAVGPDALAALTDLGMDVFVDLKLHDIPTTVRRAAHVLGSAGARWVNAHAMGGTDMLRAFVEGLHEGADDAGLEQPLALAVTVLTSEHDAPPSLLAERAGLAAAAGCGGVVCAVPDLAIIHHAEPSLQCVTPGIRPGGSAADDQVRVSTPAQAVHAGSDLLVIGRPISHAEDPVAAAAAVEDEVAHALAAAPS